MFLAFQYIISDYGSVIMLVLNGDALISNKSYKEITGNRKLICPNFHMESKKKKKNVDSHWKNTEETLESSLE